VEIKELKNETAGPEERDRSGVEVFVRVVEDRALPADQVLLLQRNAQSKNSSGLTFIP
jgi:hypothetical protein